jgi:hypothetical protein
MPAVAVGETMDAYDAVFEPYRNFIGWVGVVFVPVSHIIQQVPQLGGYLPFVYANILVGFAKLTCPCPHICIHSFMHHPHKLFGKNGVGLKGTSQCPLYGLFYVLLLKLI